MDTDDALTLLGWKNPFVIKWYFIICTVKGFAACFTLFAFVFVSMKPIDFHCRLPQNVSQEIAIPKENINGNWRFSQCKQFSNFTANASIVPCQNGYDYTSSLVETSTPMEWDLVCNDSIWNEIAISSFFILSFVGAIFCGMISDRFGRRPTFLALLLVLCCLTFLHFFASNIYIFILLRVLSGSAQQGVYVTGFCMAIELFPMKLRTIGGIADQYFWSAGCLVLVLIAYFVRTWKYFFVATSVPFIICIPLVWFLPESIPWLVSKGRIEEAKIILRRAAESGTENLENNSFNNLANLPANRRQSIIRKSITENEMETPLTVSEKKSEKETKTEYSITIVFKHPALRRWTISNIIVWFSTAILFYGIQVKTMDLGNIYLNFILTTVIEIPAYLFVLPLIKRCGRKYPMAILFQFTSVTLIIGYFLNEYIPNNSWPAIIVLLIGRLAVSAIFAIIFLYSAEMYPTTVRSTSVGMCTGAARTGVALAPFVMFLDKIYPAIPFVVLIVLSSLAGIMTLCFPETVHRSLPDRIEEIDAWVKDKPWIRLWPKKRSARDSVPLDTL